MVITFIFLSVLSRNFDDRSYSYFHRSVILCICWDTQTEKIVLWQLPIVSSVFKTVCLEKWPSMWLCDTPSSFDIVLYETCPQTGRFYSDNWWPWLGCQRTLVPSQWCTKCVFLSKTRHPLAKSWLDLMMHYLHFPLMWSESVTSKREKKTHKKDKEIQTMTRLILWRRAEYTVRNVDTTLPRKRYYTRLYPQVY